MARRSTPSDRLRASEELASLHPVTAELFAVHGPPKLPKPPSRHNRFKSLASSITAQQVSGKAAASIWQRVVSFVGEPFTPEALVSHSIENLRSCGLSNSKALSILDLAAHCLDGSVRLESLGSMDDDDVIEHLIQVRGIGVWTAQMVLLFDLERIDIWPTGDLGVRTGFRNAFGMDEVPTAGELAVLGEAFEPYRSVLAWWCWRATGSPSTRRAERQAFKPLPSN